MNLIKSFHLTFAGEKLEEFVIQFIKQQFPPEIYAIRTVKVWSSSLLR